MEVEMIPGQTKKVCLENFYHIIAPTKPADPI